MLRYAAAALTLSLICTTPALAQDKWAVISKRQNTTLVTGEYYTDGYTTKEMQSLLRQFCEGGKAGPMKLTGKTRKQRGHILAEFESSCPGRIVYKGVDGYAMIDYRNKGKHAGKHRRSFMLHNENGKRYFINDVIKP